MAQATTDVEQLVRDCIAATHDENYAEIPDYVSESFVLYEAPIPEEGVAGPEGEAHGPEGLEQYMRLTHTAFPDLEVTISTMLSNEETVMYEATMSSTWEGEWLGIPPTGNEVEVPFVEVVEVADGAIQEMRSYLDTQDALEQMGVGEG